MNRVNELILCRHCYKTKEDFENAIKDAIFLLLEAEYLMTIRYDEKEIGVVAIEYNYDNLDFGTPMPYWLFPDEYHSVVCNDEREENDNNDDDYQEYFN